MPLPKALRVARTGQGPIGVPAETWFPPVGAMGTVVHVIAPDIDFDHTVVLWDDDPEGELRMIDIWKPDMRIITETKLNGAEPILQKIAELLERFSVSGECGE